MIGLILVGGGIMMLSISQGDQSKAVSQKARSDGLLGTQAGLARVQEYLNTVRVMARYNSTCASGENCWANASLPSSESTGITADQKNLQKELSALNASASCTTQPKSVSNALDDMRAILKNPDTKNTLTNDTTNKLFLYYKIEKYEYKPITDFSSVDLTQHIGTGILTLTGLSSKRAWSTGASTDNGESENRLVVSLPVLASNPVAFTRTTAPALWIQEGGIEDKGETISASNFTYSKGSLFQGDVVMSDPKAFVNETTDPDNVLRSKLECFINYGSVSEGSSNNPDNSKKKILQSTPELQPQYRAQFFPAEENEKKKGNIVPALNFPATPDISANVSTSQRSLDRSKLLAFNTSKGNSGKLSITFPRRDKNNLIVDTATTRRIDDKDVSFYEYEFDSLELQANDSITIDSSNGARVIFFVKGNLALNENSTLEHMCGTTSNCDPTNFQIIASKSSVVSDRELCLRLNNNTNKTLAAFIFAPDYKLGIKDGQLKGAMWGKSWGKIEGCSNDNNKGAIVQAAAWSNLVVGKPSPVKELPQIGRIMGWCEEAIDTIDSQCVPTIIRPLGGQTSSSPTSP
ncbi:hypothetical protein [Pannus brasiliensis]